MGWATEYMKLAYVGAPTGYGTSAVLGGGLGAALGGGAGALIGAMGNRHPLGAATGMLAGGGIGALIGGGLGTGAGLLHSWDQHKAVEDASAFEAEHPEMRDQILRAYQAGKAGIPLSPEAEAKIDQHLNHLQRLDLGYAHHQA